MYKGKLLACKQPELTNDIRQQVSKMEKVVEKKYLADIMDISA